MEENKSQGASAVSELPKKILPLVTKALIKAKDVCVNPAGVWDGIKSDGASAKDLYLQYLLVVVAIGPVFGFLGMAFSNLGLTSCVVFAVLTYLFGLATPWVVALLIEFLAPKFGGSADRISALKLVAYSAAPTYLASVLRLFHGSPTLGLVQLIASIYGLYIFWKGVPAMTQVPQAKTIPFVIVLAVLTVIVWLVFGAIITVIAIGGAAVTAIPG